MIEIIGVRFKPGGKVYYFDPRGFELSMGDNVIVETARGIEFGEVVLEKRTINGDELENPLKSVIRVADKADIERRRENKRKEKEAYEICLEKISRHKLDMKLIEVEYTFDGNKILFYFTADGRIDFRELVKDLANVFHTRIELRQIGVRDEAKTLGSVGICGRGICCSTFLGDFVPVSIKMAKEQGLSLNPAKISGVCGRLMCCLKYEQDTYEELLKVTPRAGSVVQTPNGRGTVEDVNLLKGIVRVKIDSGKEKETVVHSFNTDEVKIIKRAANADKSEKEEKTPAKKSNDKYKR